MGTVEGYYKSWKDTKCSFFINNALQFTCHMTVLTKVEQLDQLMGFYFFVCVHVCFALMLLMYTEHGRYSQRTT